MPPQVILQTPRLFVRAWLESDVEPLRAVFMDPRVTRFTEGRPWCEHELRGLARWCLEHGAGVQGVFFNCPLVARESGEVIGRVGINRLRAPGSPYEGQPEIEWTLAASAWGKGYATEIGAAMLAYAFAAGLERLLGFAHPENYASRRVLEKIGLVYQGVIPFRDEQAAFYQALNPRTPVGE